MHHHGLALPGLADVGKQPTFISTSLSGAAALNRMPPRAQPLVRELVASIASSELRHDCSMTGRGLAAGVRRSDSTRAPHGGSSRIHLAHRPVMVPADAA